MSLEIMPFRDPNFKNVPGGMPLDPTRWTRLTARMYTPPRPPMFTSCARHGSTEIDPILDERSFRLIRDTIRTTQCQAVARQLHSLKIKKFSEQIERQNWATTIACELSQLQVL